MGPDLYRLTGLANTVLIGSFALFRAVPNIHEQPQPSDCDCRRFRIVQLCC